MAKKFSISVAQDFVLSRFQGASFFAAAAFAAKASFAAAASLLLGFLFALPAANGVDDVTVWQSPSSVAQSWSVAANWSDGVPTDDDVAEIDNGGTALIGSGTSAVAMRLYAGNLSSGNVIQSGGSLTIEDFFGFVVAHQAGATGSYRLDGGDLQLGRINSYVGYQGVGSFEQAGGMHFARSLKIGEQLAGDGQYTISGGKITLSDDLVVGNFGQGSFFQSGGEVAVQDVLRIASAAGSRGEYTLSDGMVSTKATTIHSPNTNAFVQTGGVHTTDSIGIGSVLSGTMADPEFASYTLSGDGEVQVNQSIVIGQRPYGAFVQESGDVNVDGLLTVGAGSGEGSSRYQMNGGELKVNFANVGAGVEGVFDHVAGKVTVVDMLHIGVGNGVSAILADKAGEYNMTSGELSVGGESRIGGSRQSGKPADFNLMGGSHHVGEDLTIGPSSSGPANFNALGGSLRVDGDVRLGLSIRSEGVFRVVGADAEIDVMGNFVMGPINDFFQNHELAVIVSEEGLTTIDVAGNAELRGRLHVGLDDGFLPTFGATYEVLTADNGITGDLSLVGPAAQFFDLQVLPNSLVLSSTVPEPSTLFLLTVLLGVAWARRAK